ncbi:NAD-dependent epimerase/dehydratase family protein [Sphingomonas sp. ABOLD]|uniref:dTDP-4-dehydrorhamnose reductase n=1 Tax=Sphingomonas trueperi TaxID=53317 RepID=A0A7X5Y024_9SPHN|nr:MULTISPECIES: SDR family oxidoreductase [Sphingomonas]NJB98557.1 dTDP-4-dehydrorhamnose reductase [Sphingomonas trueperi]RSV44514.1 NAD-dependent epimerase/dehydratase family protein [Sphingomonas sp. ABOLD]
MSPLELWGGAECTVNRVGDRYRDQTIETGHHDRLEDLDRIAALGVTALRFPVLWERVCPDDREDCDWGWSDTRLARMRALGMRPIAGLVHHGSGPRRTDLLDPEFGGKLGDYAARVAERYPWIADWTPVNEPLTTARFAALYGHWYPHARDEGSFWRALVHQVEGVVCAMAAVRAVRPDARLIQTDDLGKTYGTPGTQAQVAYDNDRRWMCWDLLCGRVVPGHALWERLAGFGLAGKLEVLADAPCPPDVIGINHYLTSDRFLDENVAAYPPAMRGGNGSIAYVDTEAVRVLDPAPDGLANALAEAWARYRIPIAITEVHNGCTREEQMRWMRDAWEDAEAARAAGVAVQAVTAWSLFGASGWNTLLTEPGIYEPGVFDVRGGEPRPTAMVPLLRALARGERLAHPALHGEGWWRRDLRVTHHPRPHPNPGTRFEKTGEVRRTVLIAGATGTLGQALARSCEVRGLAYVLASRAMLDLKDGASIAAALGTHQPWAVINAAGWVRVDDAEDEEAACFAGNCLGATELAMAAAERHIATVSFSSDLVFDGALDRPYTEADPCAPLGAYGRSKAALEAAIGGLPGRHLVVRTAAFFSPWDQHNFAVHVVEALAAGRRFAAADDQVVSPAYVPDLCNAVLDELIDGTSGILHLANRGAVHWADFATSVAEACGLPARLVDAVPGRTLGWKAPRPRHVPLASQRMPSLETALQAFATAPEVLERIERAGQGAGALQSA